MPSECDGSDDSHASGCTHRLGTKASKEESDSCLRRLHFPSEDEAGTSKMSVELGVSYSSMLIQLRKYNLLEQRSMEEYFKKTMTDGGAVYGC